MIPVLPFDLVLSQTAFGAKKISQTGARCQRRGAPPRQPYFSKAASFSLAAALIHGLHSSGLFDRK